MAKPECFRVDPVDESEHAALKALGKGEADAYQQKLALKLITNKFCRTHDMMFIPGAPDQSNFLSGRSFPGQQIMLHLKIPVGKLVDDNNDEE